MNNDEDTRARAAAPRVLRRHVNYVLWGIYMNVRGLIGLGISGSIILVVGCGSSGEELARRGSYESRQALSSTEELKGIRLVACDGAADDQLGQAVAIGGTTVFVGAPGRDAQGKTATGAVYTFSQAAVAPCENQKIALSDPQNHDLFGWSVAASEDLVVVGAPTRIEGDVSPGAAYIFARSGDDYQLVTALQPNDPAHGAWFGHAVAIEGDHIAVSAPYAKNDKTQARAGAVYVFQKDGDRWAQVDKLTSPTGKDMDSLGWSVAMSGRTIVAGAPHDDDHGDDAGAVYVFGAGESGYTLLTELYADDAKPGDGLGSSVALAGHTVVTGAPQADTREQDAGAAYVFEPRGSDWRQTSKLALDEGALRDAFGHAVAISDDRIVIGSRRGDTTANDTGAAYVFQRRGDAWERSLNLVPNEAQSGIEFGFAVAISGSAVVVGAFRDDAAGHKHAGSIYRFEL